MSVSESSEPREGTATQVAGYLAAASIAVSAIGIAYRPVRTIPIAILVALIAVVMGGPNQRLGPLAVLVGAIAFVVGMTIAVATASPLW
jgi:predicted membrane protein